MDTKIVRYILCRMLGVEAGSFACTCSCCSYISGKMWNCLSDTNCYIMPAVLGGRKKRPEHGQIYGKEADGDRCSGMDFVVFIRSNAIHPFRVYTLVM